jgi:hypothetical protein
MTAFHIALGVGVVVVNFTAAAWGAWCWWRDAYSRAFWILLRAGQALVIVAAADGAVLAAMGRELPDLHLIYGLTPLVVSFLGEQLRLASADSVLQARGLEDSAAVGRLEVAEQQAVVRAIVRREMGVMAASAAVVTLLGLRAGGWL